MCADIFLSPVNYLAGDALSAISMRLFWLKAKEEQGCEFVINHKTNDILFKLMPGEAGFFAVKSKKIFIKDGSVNGSELKVVSMAKLQAFIDAGNRVTEKNRKKEILYGFSQCRLFEPLSRKKIEYWLLSQSVKTCQGMEDIVQLIRDNECYWIVNYLLTHADGYKSLREIGGRYGLSVSHFRRLSKSALGNTAKVEMCDWRLIRAILDIMGDEHNLTAVAMKHGYASLSHFSGDVKNRFGIPPRDLKKMINCELLK